MNGPSVGARRRFLQLAGLSAGVATGRLSRAGSVDVPASWQIPGRGFSNYGQPDDQSAHVIRWASANPALPGEGVSWTPLHDMAGTITPNGLHFERHHNGVPDIDAERWSLVITGGQRALSFGLDTLHRYPMQSRLTFIECGGNSNALWHPEPLQAASGHLHGLVSGCEWTGVPLALLLQEAGLAQDSRWLIADGLDAAGVTVSLPLDKCLDDVLLALYQNGEPLRAENGFPARLVVPGWEGVTNLKWVRALTLSDRPVWSRFDTVSYTDLRADGIAERMSFEMGVKSVITSPCAGQTLSYQGLHEVRGLAWSGAGHIREVQVSIDGGRQWQQAQLQSPVLDKALTRFRLSFRWNGESRLLLSRARHSSGAVQPSRAALLAQQGMNAYYHFNAVCGWAIDTDGVLSHVYA